MTDGNEFPTFPQSQLSREEIVNYLLEQKRRGYEVYQDPQLKNNLILVLNETHRINFIMGSVFQIQGVEYSNDVSFINVSTMAELRSAVDKIAQSLVGTQWKSGATRARVSQDTPASNYASIANLIGSSSVVAVFDPYLENQSLTALLDILSFGSGSVADGVRILSTKKTITGQVPRLTKVGFDAWLKQLGINGELRIMQQSEHRRFMLLSGAQSLLLGHSLNAIHKNEAVRIEPDNEDKVFFEHVWVTATPIA